MSAHPPTTLAPAASAAAALPLRQISELPGPKGWPVLGSLPNIQPQRFHLQLEGWARQYGRFYKLKMGAFQLLIVADHEAVAAVLRDRPEGFRRTARLEAVGLEMGLKGGLFGVNGEDWKRQRRMVMAAFDPGNVKRYCPALLKCADRLQARWQQAARAGQSIDLQADLMRFTVDAIAGLAFGTDVNTLQSDDDVIQNHLDKIFPKLYARLIAAFPYWRYFKTPSDRALDRAMVAVDTAIDGFIHSARQRLAAEPARREHPHNLLEAMLVAADEPGSGIDDSQVAGNVMTMLLAGEDTTANTLAWCIWLLHQHPAALQRAQAEVRRVMAGAERVSLAHLDELEFVEACMHETMRLKPVAPQIPLQALHDTVVGDVAVPKDTVVMCLMRVDSVDEQFVEAARSFKPERWLRQRSDEAATQRSAESQADSQGNGQSSGPLGGQASNPADLRATSVKRLSMPFGAGARICPGRYLALQEMKLVSLTLLKHFDVQSVDTADGSAPAECLQFAMAPVGLRMRLAPRAC